MELGVSRCWGWGDADSELCLFQEDGWTKEKFGKGSEDLGLPALGSSRTAAVQAVMLAFILDACIQCLLYARNSGTGGRQVWSDMLPPQTLTVTCPWQIQRKWPQGVPGSSSSRGRGCTKWKVLKSTWWGQVSSQTDDVWPGSQIGNENTKARGNEFVPKDWEGFLFLSSFKQIFCYIQ